MELESSLPCSKSPQLLSFLKVIRPTTFHLVYLRSILILCHLRIHFRSRLILLCFSAETLHDSAPCLPHPRLFHYPDNLDRSKKSKISSLFSHFYITPPLIRPFLRPDILLNNVCSQTLSFNISDSQSEQ